LIGLFFIELLNNLLKFGFGWCSFEVDLPWI